MYADFDNIAKNYDDTFTFSEIGKRQRFSVYTFLKQLPKNQNILELNCGTGQDALWLIKQGHTILATDISKEMLRLAQKKADNSKAIRFEKLDIKTISKANLPKNFDVIFSNFGGLNCLNTNELKAFFKSVYNLLPDKGKLILVIMPKNTLWEFCYFIFKRDFKNAVRRCTNKPVYVNLGKQKVATWYYNPKDIKQFSEPYFKVKHIYPIGFFIPPSYLENYFSNHKLFLSILGKAERLVATFGFLSRFSDHYLIEIEKNN